ncbi:MAG: AAA family ATPase [Oscillospiraceae bacterium]|nr:AAA family ATPase [Oscillospiraceae bacterium]
MRKNLVDSKIQKPSVYSPNFIFREGLVERLGDRQKHLLVLHATVGYGKTVLLTHYAQETPDTCAWYHLNDTDNDIAVFMQYLCSSVKKCLPDFDFDPDAFTPFLQEREAVKTMAHIFVARMEKAVRSASQDLILIFDDFQAIEENEEIQQIIQLILNNTTEKIRLILAT